VCGALLLVGIVFPTLEFYVLIEVGSRLGATQTIALVFLTAGVGLWMARGQGLAVLRKMQQGIPAEAEVLAGPLLALGALLLVLPGFISDGFGLVLMIPPLRRGVARFLVNRFGRPPRGPGGPGVIVVKGRRIDGG